MSHPSHPPRSPAPRPLLPLRGYGDTGDIWASPAALVREHGLDAGYSRHVPSTRPSLRSPNKASDFSVFLYA